MDDGTVTTVRGVVQQRVLQGDSSQTYYMYEPSRGGAGSKLFVTVHGISRNAEEHAELFAPFAEAHGAVMISPLFDTERFPDYNCLGREGRGARSDHALERLVREVGAITGADTGELYLFGYSAGGQFAHRFAMAHPERVARLVVGAAGWYTFPDGETAYPQGLLAPTAELPGVEMAPDKFLRIPTAVFVGERDVERTSSLNQEPEIDARQGMNRVERGQRWTEAMRSCAASFGIAAQFQYDTLPLSSHSFGQCMTNGGLGKRVYDFMFGGTVKA